LKFNECMKSRDISKNLLLTTKEPIKLRIVG
jgi:hypothetical protein